MTKSKAQLNEILTTTTRIHRTEKQRHTRRVATQTAITLTSIPAQWTERLRGEDQCNDDSNNNRVSSAEKLKLESQIDSERTAVAALTELGYLKKHHSEESLAEPSSSTTTVKKEVTSSLLNNLSSSEAISLIPVAHDHLPKAAELREKLKDMSQLETAAVLMDISKKVIISPPHSNPHSPPYNHRGASERSKRTNSSDMMMDLSIKRVKVEPMSEAGVPQRRESVIKTEHGRSGNVISSTTQEGNNEALLNTLKNRHQLNVIKLNDNHGHSPSPVMPGLTVLNVDRLNNGVHFGRTNVEAHEEEEEDIDDDSSDPGRLQVDVTLEEDYEAQHMRNGGGKPARRPAGNVKARNGRKGHSNLEDSRVPSPMMMGKNAGMTTAQLAASAMASMASAAGGGQDAAGLWHLIAQTTLNNNNGLPMGHQNKEAVQLLQQMIQNKNMQLNLPMPQLNLAALSDLQQPLSLLKVCFK